MQPICVLHTIHILHKTYWRIQWWLTDTDAGDTHTCTHTYNVHRGTVGHALVTVIMTRATTTRLQCADNDNICYCCCSQELTWGTGERGVVSKKSVTATTISAHCGKWKWCMSHGKLYQLAEGLLRAAALVSAYPRTFGPHTTHTHTHMRREKLTKT